MSTFRIVEGDCTVRLAELDAGSIQTCVTSPPYWGLRDYGTGGGQLGLEPTPEQYVANLVAVFREVRRVLRDDATLWLNLGDSYAAGGSGGASSKSTLKNDGRPVFGARAQEQALNERSFSRRPPSGLKPKDLVGIPWMVAFALRADGWVLRSEIIWNKPNPMPESVTDRPTKAHEQLFLFSKARWTGADEPLPMREADAAWLAALVDGEGSICFQDRTSQGASVPTYSVRLSIVNTNRALLERVTEICGLAGVGAPSPRTRKDGNEGRPIFAWQVTNAKAAKVIAAIRPYLIAKQQQADLALYVQALNRKHKGRGGHTVSKADGEAKAKAAAACSALNRGREVDLAWFKPPKPGRWVPLPYVYDADAIREEGKDWTRGGPGTGIETTEHYGNGNGGNAGLSDLAGRYKDGEQAPGRNKRTVWTVTTQPFPGAHFATFPPKLIEPCILAGSPPKCCGECGAPWERVVVATAPDGRSAEVRGGKAYDEDGTPLMGDNMIDHGVRGSWNSGGATLTRETAGWRATCDHDDDSGTATVLDPFNGAGTTGLVALRHDRDYIGIELNPEYAQMARDRIVDDAPLLNAEAAA